MTNDDIKAIALANGFTLREQPDGSMDLNPYVYGFARAMFGAGFMASRPSGGHTMQRDQNSALVALIDAHTPGTGVAARPKPLARQRAKSKSLTRETPATTTQGV